MKVVTVTFHYSINYGAVLQCYALQKKLINMGYDTCVLNYVIDKLNREQHLFNITPSKNIFKRCLSFIKQGIRFIINFKQNKNQIQRERKFSFFIKNNIRLTKKISDKKKAFDFLENIPAVIVGSDQVWNPRITYGLDEIYYLKNYNGKKISYAASLGEEKNDSNITDDYFDLIAGFDNISVRENSGREFLKTKIGNDVEVNIDPVFLLDETDYNIISKNVKNEEYILIYSVENNKDFIKFVNKIVKQIGITAIVLNKDERYDKCIKYYNAGIDEFLGLIKNANIVLTNSFHGTAFSLIFEKEFLVFPHSKRPERVQNLLDKLELFDRIVINDFNIKSLNKKINYRKIKKTILQEVEKSEKYLKKTLGE